MVKKIVKGAAKVTLPVGLMVGGAKLSDMVTVPLLGRALDLVGLLKFIPAGAQALISDVSRGLHGVAGFALGHGAADWIGKKLD